MKDERNKTEHIWWKWLRMSNNIEPAEHVQASDTIGHTAVHMAKN